MLRLRIDNRRGKPDNNDSLCSLTGGGWQTASHVVNGLQRAYCWTRPSPFANTLTGRAIENLGKALTIPTLCHEKVKQSI